MKISNIKCKNITYLDYKAQTNRNTLKDLRKLCVVRLNCNSIDLDVLKANTKYYNVKTEYFKANGRDTLFVDLIGENHDIIRLFIKYNTILKGLTYQEKHLLNQIRTSSYVTKKYNFSEDITLEDEEKLFKIYLPNEQVDYYDDYDNFYNQSVFKNKRINYNKKDIKKQDVITKTLEQACKLITDFKLSNTPIKINSNTFKDIFNYRLKVCSFKLHNNYHRVKSNYDSYEEFIKYVVFYGASHYSNQRFWEKIKRELY